MPNKNNKNKPNGFVIYANEIRDDLLRQGHIIRNMPDLIAAASPKWQALPADEREYYKDRAKWEWENNRNSAAAKYIKKPVRPMRKDNTGAYLDGREDIVLVTQEKKLRERNEVFDSWKGLGRAVTEKNFYIVSFLCLLEEPEFQPIEVAAVEFNLLGGVNRTWHKHINPGQIPTGYQYQAQQISEDSHKIPIEGIAEAGDTYTSIYDELLHFLSRGTNYIPPIHVKISDVDKVEGCIKWLARMAGRPHQLKRVYELEGLILDLDGYLNNQESIDKFRSLQMGTDLISSTIFDYESDTKCPFHQENETKFCAQGYVLKYTYLLTKYFCKIHHIPMTERHAPVKKSDEKCYTVIANNKSSRSRSSDVSNKSKADMDRESVARSVFEKLSQVKLEENNRYDEMEQKFLEDEQLKLEQKKRWLSLRGTDSGEISTTDVTDGEISEREESSQTHMRPTQPLIKPVFGRGRGRGAGNIMHTLRKPGDMIGNVNNEGGVYPSFGRGTKMYTGK